MGHGGSPSITVGSPSGMRGPSFPSPHFRIMNADTEHHPYGNGGGDGSGAGGDGGGHASSPMYTRSAERADHFHLREEDLAQSAGRQHGSFSCLSMLAEECSSPYEAQRGGYSFSAGQSAFTTPLGGNNDMAFAFSLGDRDDGRIDGCGKGSVADRHGVNIGSGLVGGGGIRGGRVAGGGDRARREAALRGGSTHGVSGERALMLPRLVVVHPSHDEDENSMSSAGKKQRGSYNSLLLLEAHRLSTHSASSDGMLTHVDMEMPQGFSVKV